MTKIGIHFTGDKPVKKIQNNAKLAEQHGFDSAWFAEYYKNCTRNSFILASAAASASNIKVGTNVINPFTRTPSLIAMSIASLNEISDKQATLGIGFGVEDWIKSEGLEYRKPLTRLKECIKVVRKLLRNKTINYSGETLQIKDVNLRFEVQKPNIPIYVAAIRDKALRTAGDIGNGIILTGCSPTGYVKHAKELVKKRVKEKDDKGFEDVDVSSIIFFSVSEDGKKAKNYVKGQIARILKIPGVGETLIKHSSYDKEILEKIRSANSNSLEKIISDEIVDEFAVAGRAEHCLKRLKEYKKCGVDNLLLHITNPRTEKAIEKVGNWISDLK